MNGRTVRPDQPVTLLMFGTLIAVLVIVGVMLARFRSKRRNRHRMAG